MGLCEHSIDVRHGKNRRTAAPGLATVIAAASARGLVGEVGEVREGELEHGLRLVVLDDAHDGVRTVIHLACLAILDGALAVEEDDGRAGLVSAPLHEQTLTAESAVVRSMDGIVERRDGLSEVWVARWYGLRGAPSYPSLLPSLMPR